MVFRRICSKVTSLYKSFFRPPSYDLVMIRRERLSIAYAVSMLCLLIFSAFLLCQSLENPERSQYATLKPQPGVKVIKLEINPVKFSIKRKREEEKEAEEKIYRENVTDDKNEEVK